LSVVVGNEAVAGVSVARGRRVYPDWSRIRVFCPGGAPWGLRCRM